MKGLKKALALMLAAAMCAGAGVAGTLAYLTDRDSEANVFTVGDVTIDLTEDFNQGATLLPGLDVTKDVKVENIGKNDAYVWVEIAMPAALDNSDPSLNVLHFNFSEESVADGQWSWMEASDWSKVPTTPINGKDYKLYTVLYNTALTPGAVTETSAMEKVYLDTRVDIDPEGKWYKVENGVATELGWSNADGRPIMYVSAYAIQAEGFADVKEAYAAYTAQWGENGKEFAEPSNPSSLVMNDGELTTALGNKFDIVLGDDVQAGVAKEDENGKEIRSVEIGGNTNVKLDGHALTADYVKNNGHEMTISNGTLKSGTAGDYAHITAGAGAVTTFDGVTVDATAGGIAVTNGAQVIFESGSVAANTSSGSNSGGRYNFYVSGEGSEVVINGGEFSLKATNNARLAYIYANAGTTVTVNGGTFGAPSTRSGYKAGIMIGETDGICGTVIIKGGTFGFNPTKWVAEGYEAVQNGSTWTVSAK